MIGRNDTFATHAEDPGIVDQTLWDTVHDHFMMLTIRNPITDVNCLGAISRFAIHVEPILIPLSLRYLVWPSVNAPYGFLPLLAPWMAALALPSCALNLLSSDPLMFSASTSTIRISRRSSSSPRLTRWCGSRHWCRAGSARRGRACCVWARRIGSPHWFAGLVRPGIALAIVAVPLLIAGHGRSSARIYQQVTVRHAWPTLTAYDRLGAAIAARIPPQASVSAQSTLAPHVSQRAAIYQFPSGVSSAD